jgi:hypothetical protein
MVDVLKEIPKELPNSRTTVTTKIPPGGKSVSGYADQIILTSDNIYTLYVNGKEIATDKDWTKAESYKLGLKSGMLVCVMSSDFAKDTRTVGLACLLYNGKKVYSSPHNWYYHKNPPRDWLTSNNLSGWKKAAIKSNADRPTSKIKGLEKTTWMWSPEKNYRLYFKFIVP